MEIKERRGRVAAGKHRTHPVTVRMRTVPMVSELEAERLGSALALASMVPIMLLGAWLEGSTWPM